MLLAFVEKFEALAVEYYHYYMGNASGFCVIR